MTALGLYLAGIVALGTLLNAGLAGFALAATPAPSGPLAALVALFHDHPEVGAVVVFLAAVAAHITIGALLHATRLHDFDWGKLGLFVEHDFATARGLAILTTFLLTLTTTVVPGSDFRAAFGPAFATLAASCAAATLPILRDTLSELGQLVNGVNPAPARRPLRS